MVKMLGCQFSYGPMEKRIHLFTIKGPETDRFSTTIFGKITVRGFGREVAIGKGVKGAPI